MQCCITRELAIRCLLHSKNVKLRHSDIQGFFVRKAQKKMGLKKIEGNLKPPIVILDDGRSLDSIDEGK